MNISNPAEPTDWLGVLNALVQHMKEGHCCDNLNDEKIFKGPVNRLVGKIQMVVDENFGGDYEAFHRIMLIQIVKACYECDEVLLAIENWLDAEWQESAKLYQ